MELQRFIFEWREQEMSVSITVVMLWWAHLHNVLWSTMDLYMNGDSLVSAFSQWNGSWRTRFHYNSGWPSLKFHNLVVILHSFLTWIWLCLLSCSLVFLGKHLNSLGTEHHSTWLAFAGGRWLLSKAYWSKWFKWHGGMGNLRGSQAAISRIPLVNHRIGKKWVRRRLKNTKQQSRQLYNWFDSICCIATSAISIYTTMPQERTYYSIYKEQRIENLG